MLLVDAYNVLHAQWRLPPHRRGLDVRGLIALIGRSRHAGRRLRVVCDGRPGPEWARGALLETGAGLTWTRVGRAEVVWSGRGREADDVIEEVLAGSRGLSILVVSSDRRLIRAAGRAGADRIGNGAFLDQLAADERAREREAAPAFAVDVPLDHYSVAHWMREFGFEPPDPSRVARGPVPTAPTQAPAEAVAPPSRSAGFGQRLAIPMPAEGGPTPPPPVAHDGSIGPTREREPLDPLLAFAFEEWCGRLDPADLDMERWIDGVTRLGG